MRSITFSGEAWDAEEIEADVKSLRQLGPAQLQGLSTFLSEPGHLSATAQALAPKAREFVKESGVSPEQWQRAWRLCRFLVRSMDKGDPPEIVIDDVSTLVALGPVEAFLRGLLPAVRENFAIQRREERICAALPFLQGVSYVCDVRMIPEKRFRAAVDKASDYQPTATEWVPVAILNISTDEDAELHCQIDLHRLKKLLDVFQAISKDLQAAHDALRHAGLPAVHQKSISDAEIATAPGKSRQEADYVRKSGRSDARD